MATRTLENGYIEIGQKCRDEILHPLHTNAKFANSVFLDLDENGEITETKSRRTVKYFAPSQRA